MKGDVQRERDNARLERGCYGLYPRGHKTQRKEIVDTACSSKKASCMYTCTNLHISYTLLHCNFQMIKMSKQTFQRPQDTEL